MDEMLHTLTLRRIVDTRCQAIVDVLTSSEREDIFNRIQQLCEICVAGDFCPKHVKTPA